MVLGIKLMEAHGSPIITDQKKPENELKPIRELLQLPGGRDYGD